MLDRVLFERYSDALIASQASPFHGQDRTAMTKYLSTLQKTHAVYLRLAVTDASGRIRAATDPAAVGQNLSGRDGFQEARDRRGIQVLDAAASEDSGGILAVAFTAPITNPQGKFLGVVTSQVSIPSLEAIFAKEIHDIQAQRGSQGTIEYQFLTRDGNIIADSLLRQEGRVNLRRLALPSALFTGSAQPGYVEEIHVRRGVPVVTGYAQTKGYGEVMGLHWGILMRMDRSDILAPIRTATWKLGLLVLIVILPLLWILLWTTGRLRKEWGQAREDYARAARAEEALRESEGRYVQILDSISDMVLCKGPQSRLHYANKAFREYYGMTLDQLRGIIDASFNKPDYTRQYLLDDAYVFRTGKALNIPEEPVTRHDGKVFLFNTTKSPILNADGEVIQLVAVARDTTEQKRAEDALRASEGRYRSLYENNPSMYFTVNSEGIVLSVNQFGAGQLGYTVEELVGQCVLKVVHPDDQDLVRNHLAALIGSSPQLAHWEFRKIRKDGGLLWVKELARAVRDAEGHVVVLIVCEDITEPKRMEEALRESEARFRSLARSVITAQEDERRRIARELHDETGQWLTAMLVGLRTLEEAPTSADVQSQARELRRLASFTLGEVGRLARGLHPSVLDDLGLVAALERYAQEFDAAHGIKVSVRTHSLTTARLPLPVETALYRMAQEALTNAAKYANAMAPS
jgi:PAS domain S-box-containing protein